MQNELKMREAIVTEALTWLRTPWHHRACVKGAGTDCVFFLVGVFNAVGITSISGDDIIYYPQDIMMHRNEETVLDIISRYGNEVYKPKMGDVAVWRFGRIFSHAAIVIDWPQIIHAHQMSGMIVLGDGDEGQFVGREVRFFSLVKD